MVTARGDYTIHTNKIGTVIASYSSAGESESPKVKVYSVKAADGPAIEIFNEHPEPVS